MAEDPATALGLPTGGLMVLRVTHQDKSVKPKATVVVNKEVQQQRVGGVSYIPDTLNSCMQCWQLF